MNILFFLHPKQEVAYVYDDCTLRQVLETMEHHKYASIPHAEPSGGSMLERLQKVICSGA